METIFLRYSVCGKEIFKTLEGMTLKNLLNKALATSRQEWTSAIQRNDAHFVARYSQAVQGLFLMAALEHAFDLSRTFPLKDFSERQAIELGGELFLILRDLAANKIPEGNPIGSPIYEKAWAEFNVHRQRNPVLKEALRTDPRKTREMLRAFSKASPHISVHRSRVKACRMTMSRGDYYDQAAQGLLLIADVLKSAPDVPSISPDDLEDGALSLGYSIFLSLKDMARIQTESNSPSYIPGECLFRIKDLFLKHPLTKSCKQAGSIGVVTRHYEVLKAQIKKSDQPKNPTKPEPIKSDVPKSLKRKPFRTAYYVFRMLQGTAILMGGLVASLAALTIRPVRQAVARTYTDMRRSYLSQGELHEAYELSLAVKEGNWEGVDRRAEALSGKHLSFIAPETVPELTEDDYKKIKEGQATEEIKERLFKGVDAVLEREHFWTDSSLRRTMAQRITDNVIRKQFHSHHQSHWSPIDSTIVLDREEARLLKQDVADNAWIPVEIVNIPEGETVSQNGRAETALHETRHAMQNNERMEPGDVQYAEADAIFYAQRLGRKIYPDDAYFAYKNAAMSVRSLFHGVDAIRREATRQPHVQDYCDDPSRMFGHDAALILKDMLKQHPSSPEEWKRYYAATESMDRLLAGKNLSRYGDYLSEIRTLLGPTSNLSPDERSYLETVELGLSCLTEGNQRACAESRGEPPPRLGGPPASPMRVSPP